MRRLVVLAGAGLVGAITVTVLNELGQRVDRRAPRLDLLGERALAAAIRGLCGRVPGARKLRRMALVGDLVANTLFYGALFAGTPRPFARGVAGGALAGLAAAALAPAFGLERRFRARPQRSLTVAWYAGAGLAASALYAALTRPRWPEATQQLPISRTAL